MSVRATQLDVYRTAIGMRSFEHAAAARELAEAIVVRAAFSDGTIGWGETLPRAYVTGETLDSVPADIEETVWPAAAGTDFAARDAPGSLPVVAAAGRCIRAAACAVELACVDAWLARRGPQALAELNGGRPIADAIAARVSGVLGSSDPDKTARRLRRMRCFGLRDFKLKLGFGEEIDAANLAVVDRRIGGAIAAGRCTLRVDANNAWDPDAVPERIAALKPRGVCVVEEPTSCTGAELVALSRRSTLPLMADESLLGEADAHVLLAEPRRVWWNVRISKNGGLTRAMHLTDLAAAHGVPLVIGGMVGESGILSAAQRRLLQAARGVRFVEGNYGRFLLKGDLARPSIRFGFGGRLDVLRGPGLGVRVDPGALERLGRHVRTFHT